MKLLNLTNSPALLRNDAFASLESVFNNLWNNAFEDHAFIHNISKEMYPRIDIIDLNDKIQIIAEVPHFNKQDIKIKFEQGVLTIQGSRNDKEPCADVKYIRREIKRSNFSRSFAIDDKVYDAQNIEATFVNGVLAIHINKIKAQEKQPVFISVK
jgi:HSP20 family protein